MGASIDHVVIRDARLRWPIADDLAASLIGQRISGVERRAKYLIISCDNGFVLAHLGMTGSLRITSAEEQVKTHDHWDFLLSGGAVLRYHDLRRFGSLHYIAGPQLQHPLLTSLGPEPLSEAFTGVYLYQLSRRRKQAVKLFLMDAKIVVGVGNIYANEALFAAGIDPRRAAGRVSLRRYELLAAHVKRILASAIERGAQRCVILLAVMANPVILRKSCRCMDAPINPALAAMRYSKRSDSVSARRFIAALARISCDWRALLRRAPVQKVLCRR